MIARLVAAGIALSFVAAQGRAQEAAPAPEIFRRDTLNVSAAQPFQLVPIVLPGSERVLADGVALDTTRYRLDYRYARLRVDDVSGIGELVVEYRTLPFRFRDLYRRHALDEEGAGEQAEAIPPGAGEEPLRLLPATSALQHNGSITRGMLVGNNRDVTLESGLRMQLSGPLSDQVHVQAVLTDENTPILPEGTTQRIEEFDRVFIGLDVPHARAELGDFDLRFASGEFSTFSRRLQGASVMASLPDGSRIGGRVKASGAVTRGLFRSQEIEPLDGVQGPYRLEGAAGERFVLIVPGSETVFVDGQRLVRGETNDYVIDYATAEISFTQNLIVTADKRIKVEFQYSTSRFTRTLAGVEMEMHFLQDPATSARGMSGRFGISVIREADSRDFSEEFGFGAEDSLALARAGDGVATSGAAQRVEFDPEVPYVQYRREIRPGADTVYVALDRAPLPSEAVFRVRFTHVGEGLGSYERTGRAVNGILYEYRGPGRGSYLPVRLLPRPEMHRMIDMRGAFSPVPAFEVFGEWGRSLNDKNRLSTLDAADDIGDAVLAGIRLKPSSLGGIRLSGEIRRRHVASEFAAFDRIRPVEFERRWNITSRRNLSVGSLSVDETIDEGNLRFDFLEASNVRGELGRIALGDGFEADRLAAYVAVHEGGMPRFDYEAEAITANDSAADEQGRWFRQSGSMEYPFGGGRLSPRIEFEHEDRMQEAVGADSLLRPSFRFLEVRPGLAWKDGAFGMAAFVERRVEDDWIAGSVEPAAASWTGRTTFEWRPSSVLDAEGSVGFRTRRFTDRFRIEQNREDAESVLLKLSGVWRPFSRSVQANVLYDGMTERSPVLQEIYIRTGPEIGQFVWEDGNEDGLVQIDEMLPERLPNEGSYVRTYIPSDTLVSVVNVRSRIRLELDPQRVWGRSDSRWKRRLSHVAARTVVEVQEKTRDPNTTSIYLLDLSRFRNAEHTMNGRLRLGQDIFLFRSSPDYGLDISLNRLRSLSELAAGQEERFVDGWRMEGRWRPGPNWGLRAVAAGEQDRLASDAFASRRYDVSGFRLEPGISYSVSDRIQVAVSASYGRKKDDFGARSAQVLKAPAEVRYTIPRKLQTTLRAEVARVRLDGEALGLARFELTDGRGPGWSSLWSFRARYTVNEYLRATFSYDGRAPADALVIHTMQLQMSALF
ncbi:MAG: hypothetical protein F4Y00_02970 [Bacteroidetes bacterium SB0662_bin_6]|nr:hypothetical protein [Bacteroidetes bacterium SB0668_bin_1]MYE03922.1 hypothetical protein [Bacteroidetes bacterium SB0662_bin_6]